MLSEYECLAFPRAISKSLAVMDMEGRIDEFSFKVLERHFSYMSSGNFYNARTWCSLPDRRMQPWPEPPGHVNRLQVKPPFGLLGAEVKHLRQAERLKANISKFQGVPLHLEPKENKA